MGMMLQEGNEMTMLRVFEARIRHAECRLNRSSENPLFRANVQVWSPHGSKEVCQLY